MSRTDYILHIYDHGLLVQAEGRLADGREFDFYAKHGHWRLMLTYAESEVADDDGEVTYMDEDEIRAFLDDILPRPEGVAP